MGRTVFQDSYSVAANEPGYDILQNKRFRILDRHAFLTLYATGSALGVQLEMYVGKNNVMEKSAISAANRIPQTYDMLVNEIEGLANQQMQLVASNTTASAVTVFWRIDIDDNVTM
jgi:hypothetical protein